MQASNCIPAGTTLFLSRQSQIDSFPINYPGCDVIDGSLTISGNDIVNLNGLVNVKSFSYIDAYLTIIDCPILPSFKGLNNLTNVAYINIGSNNLIKDLNGLDSLTEVGSLNITRNNSLINLKGVNSRIDIFNSLQISSNDSLQTLFETSLIDTINGIEIFFNESLKNITGLKSLEYVKFNISIRSNESLKVLNGFDSIKFIGGFLNISDNYTLDSIDSFQNLNSLYGLDISNNYSLDYVNSFNFLDSVTSIGINNNQTLKSLSGFNKLKIIRNSMSIVENNDLVNIDVFQNLEFIGENLWIVNNANLINLFGLNKLSFVGQYISIKNNSKLTNLNNLQNLTSVKGFSIQNNLNLQSLNNLFYNIKILASFYVFDNPKLNCCYLAKQIIQNNPTLTTTNIAIYNNDIGCSSVPEVMALTPTSTCCITSYTKDTITICQGQNIKVGTNTYSTTGIYNDTIKIGLGCDSIIITNLTVRPKSYQIVNKSLCVGQQFSLSNGKIITTNGIFKDTIPNFCDSIIEYRVSFVNNIIVNQNATVCQGKNYILPKGNSVNTTGIYNDTLRASFGCDSIIITNLTIKKPVPVVISISVCKGKNFTLPSGKIVTSSGFYFDTIRSPNTCDSIVITNLTITNPTLFTNNITLCKGKNYTLPNGNIVSNSGTYYDTIRKPNTCDSIVITNLTVNPYLQSSQTSTICLGKTFTLPTGKIVSQSGIYKDTIQDNNGCDSIITTNLIVTNLIPFIKKDSICDGQSYTLPNGKTVTNAGVYNDTIKKVNTCDSVITTTLSVFPNVFSVQLNATDSIDAGNSIELKPTYTNDSATIWNWSPVNNLSCIACENPIANPTQNNMYIVKATTQNGCQDTAKTTIIVKQVEVHIPTAFSPNYDGVNDELTVFVNNPISFHIAIYNRWSELLFESYDVNLKWNGKFKNEDQPVDDYTYILDVVTTNGKQHHKQGIITLVR